MTKGRFSNPFTAVFTGIKDRIQTKSQIRELLPAERLDNKTCLVTGANSGLGFAIAVKLAQRGAKVIMGCRKNYEKKRKKIQAKSGSKNIELKILDLREYDSIKAFCEQLERESISIDISIHNAGVAPPKARKTSAGLDEMFMVNYLSKFILINLLLKKGIIKNRVFGSGKSGSNSRIIIISSDSHQKASEIDFDLLGEFENYKAANRGVSLYSYNKLILNTFAFALSKRLTLKNIIDTNVFIICPGPVNSNIARDAGVILKYILKTIFFLFFKSPMKAAEPVIYLSVADELSDQTGLYLHMKNVKQMDDKVYDSMMGQKLWDKTTSLVKEYFGEEVFWS